MKSKKKLSLFPRRSLSSSSSFFGRRPSFLKVLVFLLFLQSCLLSLPSVQAREDHEHAATEDGEEVLEENIPPSPPPLTCSLSEQEGQNGLSGLRIDPNLHELEYDVGDGPRKMMVYVEPKVTTYYKYSNRNNRFPKSAEKFKPKFDGMAGKFINMSNKPVTFSWVDVDDADGSNEQQEHYYEMNYLGAFGATGTATYPGHTFVFTEQDIASKVLATFHVKAYPNNVYFYDPYYVQDDREQTEKNLSVLTEQEREKYNGWRRTLLFNEQYKAKTGRSYLGNYLREAPVHYMWPADYFDQQHWVLSKETHFARTAPPNKLEPLKMEDLRKLLDDEPRLLHQYRTPNIDTINMTLRVLSCAPRVFEIPNFLSSTEVGHVLALASGITLQQSTTGENEEGQVAVEEDDERRTRTSRNSWIAREESPIVDAIYRRAADLMRIDEALFRDETTAAAQEGRAFEAALTEELQLVHYDVGEEYEEHHDFGFTRIDNKYQGERFATLLLYLNDVPKGGETSFPRWSNAETRKELHVAPEAGKAVLFYSQLPDGNFDDFSQHAAKPVKEGEKWLVNLWVHSPRRE